MKDKLVTKILPSASSASGIPPRGGLTCHCLYLRRPIEVERRRICGHKLLDSKYSKNCPMESAKLLRCKLNEVKFDGQSINK